MHSISSPIRRGPRLPGVLVAAAVLALAVAPADGLAKGKKPVPTSGCVAGTIKKETTGKGETATTRTYVCDRDGKWVEVLLRELVDGTLLKLTLPTAAATETPTEPVARKPKPTTTPSGCHVYGDVYAATGEQITVTNYVRDEQGNVVSITHNTYKCGADGQWVAVPRALDTRMANNKHPDLMK